MAGMRRNPLTARRTGRPQNASVSGGASFSDFSELFGMGAPVASGQVVTPESAMRFSAVFACVRLLGGAVASAPVKARNSASLPTGTRWRTCCACGPTDS